MRLIVGKRCLRHGSFRPRPLVPALSLLLILGLMTLSTGCFYAVRPALEEVSVAWGVFYDGGVIAVIESTMEETDSDNPVGALMTIILGDIVGFIIDLDELSRYEPFPEEGYEPYPYPYDTDLPDDSSGPPGVPEPRGEDYPTPGEYGTKVEPPKESSTGDKPASNGKENAEKRKRRPMSPGYTEP